MAKSDPKLNALDPPGSDFILFLLDYAFPEQESRKCSAFAHGLAMTYVLVRSVKGGVSKRDENSACFTQSAKIVALDPHENHSGIHLLGYEAPYEVLRL